MKKGINWLSVAEWGFTILGAVIMGVGQIFGTRNAVKSEIDDRVEKGRKEVEKDR